MTASTEERLVLGINPTEIARIHPWIERLAAQYSIPDPVQFAAGVCLEEVLSNILLHGYKDKTDGTVLVLFTAPREGYFVFAVEDETPHFNPLDLPEIPPLSPDGEMRIGGHGLRFLRTFADELTYEELPVGNRFRMVFDSVNGLNSSKEKSSEGIPPEES
ncbi:MAG TPA: ATP-binding protein [Terriglobia bacterium]|nr:ATP-binding protein [Terriglobia bacterium]